MTRPFEGYEAGNFGVVPDKVAHRDHGIRSRLTIVRFAKPNALLAGSPDKNVQGLYFHQQIDHLDQRRAHHLWRVEYG